ncbi:MAG: hypothetical protein ABIR17_09455 [Pseudolysinimonas sp.]|uniref:hypothetical protein n=1 Tax=Pseudolysinimonas sp. TaxID=2680009 RepID=UPI003263C2FB
MAQPTYTSTQLLQSVAYPTNGTSLSAITRNASTGSTDGMTWSFPALTTTHPAVGVYTSDFESDAGGWVPGRVDSAVAQGSTNPRSGSGTMETSTSDNGYANVSATRTLTGLTIGRSYTASIWFDPDSSGYVWNVALGVTGIGAPTPTGLVAGYQQLSYQFTATDTSHDLEITYVAAATVGTSVVWDDVTLTQDAWVETVTAASTVSDGVIRSQWSSMPEATTSRRPRPHSASGHHKSAT